MPFVRIWIGFSCCLGWQGCKRDAPAPQVVSRDFDARRWFEEAAGSSNVDFKHVFAVVQRFYFPEIMCGGVCLLDYDDDGYLDLYFVQGGDLDPQTGNPPTNRMYRNRADGTFEDVTDATGTGNHGYGMGCTCGDYDQDGYVDIYVTNVGANVLFRNNGDGTFTDRTKEAGVGDPGWGTSAAFTDYDGDGLLDLFVVNYVEWSPTREMKCFSVLDKKDYCHPNVYKSAAPDTLYHNTGTGTFVDASVAANLREVFGNGLGIAPGDFNADGRMDFFVANDGMVNQLWINNGSGTFSDEALMAGCAVNQVGAAEAGMGVMAVDLEYDGDLDLFLSHLSAESNTLYINKLGQFEDQTAALGLGLPSIPFTGFGVGFADFNHDGDLDLYVANGRVTRTRSILSPNKPYAEPNLLFQRGPDGRFVEVFPRGGTAELIIESSRGAAFGDLDNDGDIDIVVVERGSKARILRNSVGSQGNWVMFRVLNRRGNYALGAAVQINAGGRSQRRQVQRAYSYCSSNDPRTHFGLDTAAKVDEVTVRWPGGTQEVFGAFAAGRIYELLEGTGRE